MKRKNLTGWEIRGIRAARGISTQKLSDSLGIHIHLTPEEIRDIELGVREVWDIELVAIAKALGVPVDALFPPIHPIEHQQKQP